MFDKVIGQDNINYSPEDEIKWNRINCCDKFVDIDISINININKNNDKRKQTSNDNVNKNNNDILIPVMMAINSNNKRFNWSLRYPTMRTKMNNQIDKKLINNDDNDKDVKGKHTDKIDDASIKLFLT